MQKIRLFLFCFLCCVLLSLVSVTGAALSENALEQPDFSYWPTNMRYSSSTLEVEGFFYNNDKNLDIAQITNLTVTLSDATGKPFVQFGAEDEAALEEIVIPSGATYPYAFTVQNCRLDPAGFDFTSYYASLQCNYAYYHCYGAGYCKICGPWRSDPASTPASTLIKIKCEACDGKGSTPCPLCDGGVLYYETKRSIDIGGGSTEYQSAVDCGNCRNGRVDCLRCGRTGWQFALP